MLWLSGVAESHLLTSLRNAAATIASLIGGRQTEAELLPIRQLDAHQKAARAAVAQAHNGTPHGRRAAASAWSSRNGSGRRGSRLRTPASSPARRPWRPPRSRR